MAYVTTTDLNAALYEEIQQSISRDNSNPPETAINNAMDLVAAKLSLRYNIAAEFAKTGDSRNSLLVMYVRDIAIYFLYKLPESVPAKRKFAYEEAISFLLECQQGLSVIQGLDPAPVSENPAASDRIAAGYEPRRPSRW
ncbi:Protein of unknown function [Pseudarcicella hirudinis]|uniref:Mu-like prophage protein gp36 n=1 Tax=Pseudarcicella hirudinis TaxID=1079859 RepID=A0A1I5MWW8_9BACT|nr:phage protein Gp36 family protein [Pseudarcicella hirudinis]SFP13988.1 Protein of unknown function [Pseudarcicella hirudinis]